MSVISRAAEHGFINVFHSDEPFMNALECVLLAEQEADEFNEFLLL